MSSESDFDMDDSDEDIVKPTNTKGNSSHDKRPGSMLSPRMNKKKKHSASDDDEDDDDYGRDDNDDDDEDDFEDTPQSKKASKSKAPPAKPAASKSATPLSKKSPSTNGTVKTEYAKPSSNLASSSASSTSLSSSTSSSSALGISGTVGISTASAGSGGDITRGANITTESAAKKLILQYLKQQNRPYSAIQIFDNLHKRIAKPTAERCLAVLAENDGGLRCKEYGKAKIYFIDQKNMSSDFSQVRMNLIYFTLKNVCSFFAHE